jgi:putative transposase
MKADRGLAIERMVELSRVSRPGFYRFATMRPAGVNRGMDLLYAHPRVALEWPLYGRPRITAELRRRSWNVTRKRV